MPTVRYQIRNEYGLADPDVYRAADKDDPEALLEGVAMAGLAGVLRQLGDLAEFAAEVFHGLHEEVMSASARGHGLMLRVQQLEAEFPSIENAVLLEIDHSLLAYSAGIDWRANVRVEQNLFLQGDMPRFILNSYEQCRGPPRLFMLDKFDVAGAGACLTRYSNPSFFKATSTSSEMIEEVQREKIARKPKKGSSWRNGGEAESFFSPIMDHSQFTASEQAPEKFPGRRAKLKHRKLRVLDISGRKSYMESFANEKSFEPDDVEIALRGCHQNIIMDGVTDDFAIRNECSSVPPANEHELVEHRDKKTREFSEIASMASCASPISYRKSKNSEEGMLLELENNSRDHEIGANLPPLNLAVPNNLLTGSGFLTDDDEDSYRSDDIGSELENYVDALNTIESEIETDSENRTKRDQTFSNLNSMEREDLELQLQSSKSGIAGSFDTSAALENVKDRNRSRSPSTVFDETSGLKINNGEAGNMDKMSESVKVVPETCFQTQSNAPMIVSINSYCTADSDLKLKPNVEEAQSLAAHSEEAISYNTKNTSEIDEHVESTFHPVECSKHSYSAMLDDGIIVMPLEVPELENTEGISGSSSSTQPMVSTVLEYRKTSNDLEIDMQYEDPAEKMTDNMNTLEMPEPPHTLSESSSVLVSSVCVKDSLLDSVDSDETNSVDNLSLKSSSFSLAIVSSILESESLAAEIGIISATREEFVRPQLSSSNGNGDILGFDALISPVIPYELELLHNADKPQKSSDGAPPKPLPSDCEEDSDVNQLQNEVSELIETIIEAHDDGLEFGNGFIKPSFQHDLQLGESKDDFFNENGNPKDCIIGQERSTVESEKLNTIDALFQEGPLLDDDELHQPEPDVEEFAITRNSALLHSANKSFSPFNQNGELEMFLSSVSRSQTLAPVLLNSSKEKLLDVIEDNVSRGNSRENEQDSNSKFDCVTEGDTDGEFHPVFQSYNACDFEEQFQEDTVSEEASLNLHCANSDSKFIFVAQDENDDQFFQHLFESSNLNSFNVQIQKDTVFEDASLNEHKPEIEELAIANNLKSINFVTPLHENGDQMLAIKVSSSQLVPINPSYFPNYMEKSLIYSNEDEQGADVSKSHCQPDAERPEDTVSQSVNESSSMPLYRVVEILEPSNMHLNEIFSDEGLHQEPLSNGLFNYRCNSELNMPSSKAYENEQIEGDASASSQGVSEYQGSSMASESMASDFKFSAQGLVEETPPLPPLPPMQWRMGKPQSESLIGFEAQSSAEVNSFIYSLNAGSMHIPPLQASEERMIQHTGPFMTSSFFKDSIQNVYSTTDSHGRSTDSLNFSELSDLSFLALSKEDRAYSHGKFMVDVGNPNTVASSLKNVSPQHTDLLEEDTSHPMTERRPNLVKLLPGLELERSLEAPVMDREALPPSSSLMLMPFAGDGMHQYGFGAYGSYDGDVVQYHDFSSPFPVTGLGISHYNYHHMFLMEGDKPNGKHRSMLSRPRDPLIEAVAAHDKSTLRKVSELDWPLVKSKEDEQSYLLEQIKNKSLNLKPATSKSNMVKAPATNLKVAAILEKANAIRQACVGSDEDDDDDDNWNDS